MSKISNDIKPTFRFKNFNDDWIKVNLFDVFEERKVKKKISKDFPLLAFAAGQGVINRSERRTNNRDFLTKDASKKKYLLTLHNDIVYNPSNLKYGAIDRNKYGQGLISPIYVTFETSEVPSFLELIVKSEKFKQRALQYEEGTVVKRQSVKPESLLSLSINLPSNKSEQTLIGQFFEKLDQNIELNQHALELLKQRKKAFLQKMFPTEDEDVPFVRFKDYNEKWINTTLGNMGETFTGLSGKTKEDFGHGDAEFITYKNIFNNTIADTDGTENVEIDAKQNEVKYGDALFTTSSETPEEVGMSSVWLDTRKNVYLNSFCFGFRPRTEINYFFLAFFLRSPQVRKKIAILAQGISRYNISKKKVMELEVKIPSYTEQVKIGNFFKELDDSITLQEQKLESLKQVKKAFLQKMFV